MKRGLKRSIVTAMFALPLSQASLAGELPAAGCVDLRDLSGGWRTGEREILIRSSGGTGARLQLDAACPAFPEGVDIETVAPGDLACPGARMFVRGGETTCPVIQMGVLSAPEVAEALRKRDAHLQAVVTLGRVEARGQRDWRDIVGSTDYCVDARFLRGWRKDNEGRLVVEVAPRRHSGHRYYRVETINGCPDLSIAYSIRLRSRNGGAAVCGYPGDKVMLTALLDDRSSPGFAPMGGPKTGAFGLGCDISRVAPMPRN